MTNHSHHLDPARHVPGYRFVLLGLILWVTGCSQHVQEPPLPQLGLTHNPDIQTDTGSGRRELTLSVMTFNVSALPWPLKRGRKAALERIGAYLGELRNTGQEPDIVLLQEAFASAAVEKLLAASGYPNVVSGPQIGDTSPALDSGLAVSLKALENRWRGEGWHRKFLGSGLYILSNYPIMAKAIHGFHYCAGWDCLANKGAVIATIWIPGMPEPLEIFNAHLNARLLAGVPYPHSLLAHNLQVDELEGFTEPLREAGHPFIFGGDFNVADSPPRIDYVLAKNPPYTLVRYYCTVVAACDVQLPMTGAQSWMQAREMQGFALDTDISVTPYRLEEWFDGPDNGGVQSDHSAYIVRYHLSWIP